MRNTMFAPVRLILLVLAIVLFFLGMLPALEPYRIRIISGGLFCWALSNLFP